MGLFGKKKTPKTIKRTFYCIATEESDEGIITTNLDLSIQKFPLFEDNNEAKVFCNQLKHHGIKASPFEMEFDKETIEQWIQKNIIFIGKKNDDLDYRCISCKELISHKQVKWKPRTFKGSQLVHGDDNKEEKLALIKEGTELIGIDEHTASPNQIFNGREYEYRGNCPKCNFELTCFWFGVKSLEKNPNSILLQRSTECPTCENMMRNEFQVWYSIRMEINDEGMKEYLVTICPKCKDEIVYSHNCDFENGIIE